MNLRFKCTCGKRFLKRVEKPTNKQIGEEMHNGFIACTCEQHQA